MPIAHSFADCVGDTPLVYLHGPSSLVPGRKILAKVEFKNPASSIKDRVAAAVIERIRTRRSGVRAVVEGTAGNTGIALAVAAQRAGLKCVIFTSPSASKDKVDFIRLAGADVETCKDVSPDSPEHFVSRSQAYAAENEDVELANQFFSLDNPIVHADTTGAEVCAALKDVFPPPVDASSLSADSAARVAFVYTPGTGGTLCGVSQALREVGYGRCGVAVSSPAGALHCNPLPRRLDGVPEGDADLPPQVGGLCDALKEALRDERVSRFTDNNPAFGRQWRRLTAEEKEKVTASRAWKAFEGTGGSKLYTSTHVMPPLLGAVDATYATAVCGMAARTARALAATDGFVVGASASLNVLASIWTAAALPEGSVVVTVLCDDGSRYLTSFYNDEFWSKSVKEAALKAQKQAGASEEVLTAESEKWVEEQMDSRTTAALEALIKSGVPKGGDVDEWRRSVWDAAEVSSVPDDVILQFE